MPRESYQRRLDALQDDVLAMGELVVERLRMALRALDRGDADLGRRVAEGDDEVNDRYLDLERECIVLVGVESPVATDLRFVAASFKILTDLERIGDLTAKLGRYAATGTVTAVTDVDIQDVGMFATVMMTDAMAAYAEADAAACRAVAEDDDTLDSLCSSASTRVVRDLLARDGSDADVERVFPAVSRLLLTVRDLERVGDHAVNIAARTFYMVENDDELIY